MRNRNPSDPALARDTRFITTGEIGPLFNKGPRWFERHKARLESEGFPKPVSRGTYLRQSVEAFRDARGRSRHDETMADAQPIPANVARAIARTLNHSRAR